MDITPLVDIVGGWVHYQWEGNEWIEAFLVVNEREIERDHEGQ